MKATIEHVQKFMDNHNNINRVLIKDVIWDFPDEQEGFLEQYEELANNGINYQTPRFGSFGVMADAFECHTRNILSWAEKHAHDKGFDNIAEMLLDSDNLNCEFEQVYEGLHNKGSEYYNDVTTALMMELSYQVCLQFQQYVERVTA